MPDLNKNKSRLLKAELVALSKIIAKKYDTSFDVKNDSAQVIPLLHFAIKSDDVVVQSYLASIYSCISQSHKRFFEQNGINLSSFKKSSPKDLAESDTMNLQSKASEDHNDTKTMTYRGQQRHIARSKENNDTKEPTKESNKGKRKIIYRGQEKWI